jgi:hypothetical protein
MTRSYAEDFAGRTTFAEVKDFLSLALVNRANIGEKQSSMRHSFEKLLMDIKSRNLAVCS